ncbi:capsule biosynthesis GfcC D2 domain-containing protein [Escherichia coli]
MIKQTFVALLLSVGASSVFAAGTVKVFSNGDGEAKRLTGAEHLINLDYAYNAAGKQLVTSAVISRKLATATGAASAAGIGSRLAELAADSSADDAAAINALRQQIKRVEGDGQAKNQY